MKKIAMSVVGPLVLVSAMMAQQRFDALRAKRFSGGLQRKRRTVEKLMEIVDEALAMKSRATESAR